MEQSTIAWFALGNIVKCLQRDTTLSNNNNTSAYLSIHLAAAVLHVELSIQFIFCVPVKVMLDGWLSWFVGWEAVIEVE